MKNKKKKKAKLPADPEPNVIEITTVATSKVIEVAAVVTIPDPELRRPS